MELQLGYSKIKIMLNYSKKEKILFQLYSDRQYFFLMLQLFNYFFSFMFFIISIIKTFKNE